MAYLMIWQRKKVAENRECKETDSISFVQSSSEVSSFVGNPVHTQQFQYGGHNLKDGRQILYYISSNRQGRSFLLAC